MDILNAMELHFAKHLSGLRWMPHFLPLPNVHLWVVESGLALQLLNSEWNMALVSGKEGAAGTVALSEEQSF